VTGQPKHHSPFDLLSPGSRTATTTWRSRASAPRAPRIVRGARPRPRSCGGARFATPPCKSRAGTAACALSGRRRRVLLSVLLLACGFVLTTLFLPALLVRFRSPAPQPLRRPNSRPRPRCDAVLTDSRPAAGGKPRGASWRGRGATGRRPQGYSPHTPMHTMARPPHPCHAPPERHSRALQSRPRDPAPPPTALGAAVRAAIANAPPVAAGAPAPIELLDSGKVVVVAASLRDPNTVRAHPRPSCARRARRPAPPAAAV